MKKAVPKSFEFFEAFLRALQDGDLHTAKEVRLKVADDMQMSASDMAELLPSGRQTTFGNRVNWARTYLNKAGLIETPLRGRYKITDEGKKALTSGEKIDLKYLEKYDAFKAFHSATTEGAQEDAEEASNESPMESLDAAFKQVNATLASELMDEIMKLSPTEFEKLVVKLLLQMGYGSGIDDAGMVTQRSNDGGIDGIIKEELTALSKRTSLASAIYTYRQSSGQWTRLSENRKSRSL